MLGEWHFPSMDGEVAGSSPAAASNFRVFSGPAPTCRPKRRRDREALGRVLVRPDVAPTVEAAEFRVPSEGQRRELHAVGDRCAPAIDDARDAAWLQGIEADLVETTELARFELR